MEGESDIDAAAIDFQSPFAYLLDQLAGTIGKQKGEPEVEIYQTSANRGSLPRLHHYIELRKRMVAEGIPIPTHPKQFDDVEDLSERLQKTLDAGIKNSGSFPHEEVYEVKLSFKFKPGSAEAMKLSKDQVPKNPDELRAWLLTLAEFAATNPGRFLGEVKDYLTYVGWRERRTMGDPMAATSLLEGTPAVMVSSAFDEPASRSGPVSTPLLLILDPDVPPRELAEVWDKILVQRRVTAEVNKRQKELTQSYHQDLNDYLPEAWEKYGRIHWAPFFEEWSSKLSEEECLERFIKEHRGPFFKQARHDFHAKHGEALHELSKNIKNLQGSKKRPKSSLTRQSEILGRLAFEVCLEGTYKGQPGFYDKVLDRYRRDAKLYDLKPNHYETSRRHAIPKPTESIRQALNHIEMMFRARGLPSPFQAFPKDKKLQLFSE